MIGRDKLVIVDRLVALLQSCPLLLMLTQRAIVHEASVMFSLSEMHVLCHDSLIEVFSQSQKAKDAIPRSRL